MRKWRQKLDTNILDIEYNIKQLYRGCVFSSMGRVTLSQLDIK